MADLQDVKIPYEILIRFGDDGTPRGAHVQYVRRVTLKGELLKEEIGESEPLDLKGFPTSTVMSDATRDALAEVTRKTIENNALRDMVADLREQVETLAAAQTANK